MINQTIRYLRRRLILLSHFMSGRFWWFNQKISRETNHSTFCNILRNQFCEITNQISKFILYWRECLVNKIICYVFSLFLTKNLFYNVKKKNIQHQKNQKTTQHGNLKTFIQSVHKRIKYPFNLCLHQTSLQGHLERHI